MENFNIFGVHGKIQVLGGWWCTKNQYIGGIALKGMGGLGQFADLGGGGTWQERGGGIFEGGLGGGLIPQCIL